MQRLLHDDFHSQLDTRWRHTHVGGGQILVHAAGLRLLTVGARRASYSDAQIDDYNGLPRRAFPWRPPLRLTLRARASGPLLGTAGFGFWNNPFSPLGGFPSLPAAVWFFFASSPSDLPLAAGVAGSGWKCATIDATTVQALRWAPLAPPMILLNRYPALHARLWPQIQRDLAIAEAAIPAPDQRWQTYSIEWRSDRVQMFVDDDVMFDAPFAPRGPLGFVAWVDNQWAVATPQGRFGWGMLAVPHAQWLDLAHVAVVPL